MVRLFESSLVINGGHRVVWLLTETIEWLGY